MESARPRTSSSIRRIRSPMARWCTWSRRRMCREPSGRAVTRRRLVPRLARGRTVAALALAAASSACSLAPRYERPATAPAPAPAVYKELDGWKIAEPSDIKPRGRWWAIYHDPALDALGGSSR